MFHTTHIRRFVSVGRHTLQRSIYLLTVLCVLVTTALPVSAMAASPAAAPQSALADTTAVAAACSVELLAAGAAAPLDHPIVLAASADAPISVPKALVDRAVFYANWRNHYSDAAAVEALIRSLFLMAGAASTADLAQLTAAVRQSIPLAELDDHVRHPLDEIVFQYMNTALNMPTLAPFTPYVWQAINADNQVDELPVDTSLLIAQSVNRYDLGVRLLINAQDYVIAAHACGSQNAAFSAGFNSIFGADLGAALGDSATDILQENPDLELPLPLTQGIQPDGSGLFVVADLKILSSAALDGLGATFDDMLNTIKEIDLGQSSIVDWFKNLLGMNDAKDKAKAKAEATEKQLKEYESGISALTTLFTHLDPQFAKGFKTVASSYLDVVKAVNKWMGATAGLGTLDSIFSLSTAMMTGNVLGAVMNVVSLFGDGKPSPEQQILEEIGKLRQQVNQLRQEMHTRFDRIDAQLNTIFTTMNERFDQIDITLGKINGNIRDVQRSLIDLDLRLSQVERNNFELLNVLGRRPLLDAINAGLDYKRITGTDMPFQPEFINFERTFHTWGTVHAFDALNTGPSQRDYGDGDLLRELRAYPLDANLNYLNGWLVAHGRPALANGMLPSPRDWLLASRAYTQLGLEWPAHMARIDVAELTELEAVGVQIEQAIARITERTAPPPAGDPFDSVFSSLEAKYAAKFVTLDNGLATIENTFLSEIRPSFADANATFDLFGGPEQLVLTAPGSGVQWIPPGYTKVLLPDDEQPFINHELSVPASVTALVTAQIHQLLGAFLNLGGSQTRIEMAVSEANRSELPCTPPLKPKDCIAIADVTITLSLFYGNTIWKTLTYTIENAGMNQVESTTDYVLRSWEGKKADFDAGAVVVPPTPDQQLLIDSIFNNLTGALNAKLENFQQILYARMSDQMSSGTLHPLIVEIAGYKALIDAFTTLGLPRAIASDEFLHAMLFGEQRLFDDTLIISTFALSATNPIAGPALLVNQRPLLKQRSDDRIALFSQLVEGYLDAIALGNTQALASDTLATGAHEEAADYLVSARHALNLSIRIARIAGAGVPPVQPGALKIFLPLVDK